MRRTALGIVVLAVLLAGCGADEVPVQTGSGGGGTTSTTLGGPIPDGADGLDEARQRWADSGIDGYTMTYRVLCFCPETVMTTEVRDGDVVDSFSVATTVAGAARVPDPGNGFEPVTVDAMFDEIQRAADEDAAEIQATYDTATGRPTRYWVDWSRMMADEEGGVEVLDFAAGDDPGAASTPGSVAPAQGGIEAVEPPVVTTGTTQLRSVQDVAQAQLSEPWGCGYGFHASNPGHTVALQLWPDSPPPAGSSTVDLATAGWRGTVELGEGLLTVDCADRDVTRDPEPDESWPVVGGTLELTVPDTLGGCGPGGPSATAVATGIAVTTPDGGTLTFAPLTLTNDRWGCFAG